MTKYPQRVPCETSHYSTCISPASVAIPRARSIFSASHICCCWPALHPICEFTYTQSQSHFPIHYLDIPIATTQSSISPASSYTPRSSPFFSIQYLIISVVIGQSSISPASVAIPRSSPVFQGNNQLYLFNPDWSIQYLTCGCRYAQSQFHFSESHNAVISVVTGKS